MEKFKENTQRDGFLTANGKPCTVGAAGVAKSREIASGVDQALEPVWSKLISQELSEGSPDPSASLPDPIPKVSIPASSVPSNGAVKRPYESTSGNTSPAKKFVGVTSPVQSPKKVLGLTSPARKLPDEKKLPVRSFQSSAFKSPIVNKPVATRTTCISAPPKTSAPSDLVTPTRVQSGIPFYNASKSAAPTSYVTPIKTSNDFRSLASIIAGAKGIVSKSPNLVLTATEMQDIAQLSETSWNDMFEDVLDESKPSSFAKCFSSKRQLTDAERREVEEWGKINFDDDF